MGIELVKPSVEQIELSVFGPGYGESSAIHLGRNSWIVVDSCINSATKRPAVIDYFDAIGVNAEQDVKLVVATHWHDDHIRGLAKVVDVCRNAKLCVASAFSRQEFLASIVSYDYRHGIVSGSGCSELAECLNIARNRGTKVSRALANKKIMTIDGSNARVCEAWSLSPSDYMLELSQLAIGDFAPVPREAKRRARDCDLNDLSVTLWISIDGVSFLLGADLEEKADKRIGWSAIIDCAERPNGRATLFKVPHHGSATSHNPAVWTDLLDKNPISILTPWNRGSGLPTRQDVERICALTPRADSS